MFKKMKKHLSTQNEYAPATHTPRLNEFIPNEETLRMLFSKSADVFFNSTYFRVDFPIKVTFVGCEGMVDYNLLNQLIIERLSIFFNKYPQGMVTKENVQTFLHVPQLTEVNSEEQVMKDLFSGKIILCFEGNDFLFSSNIGKRPQRSIEEATSEVTINGPRDNLIEDLSINIALIRKRLRTNTLSIEHFEVGKRSITKIAILYMEEISNLEMVQGLIKKIKAIDVDGIFNGNQFMELIEKPSPFFPFHDYTGRPDFSVQSLLKGRILILIDGVAYSIITPITLFTLLKTAEDPEYTVFYSSFERTLRVVGVAVATFLPGFWVALTTFHQNQIPLILLATVVQSRIGLPLPSSIEAILMVLMFELFKEAGMRLPTAIGSTLSVLGALIIGDAAISAGLTSPAMLVVIAASAIATFTLVNQSLVGAVSLLRIISIIFSSFLGLFGFLFSILLILTYISNIRVFGVPYLPLAANLKLSNILKSILRIPANLDKNRADMIFSKDSTKKRS